MMNLERDRTSDPFQSISRSTTHALRLWYEKPLGDTNRLKFHEDWYRYLISHDKAIIRKRYA